jgi:DNA-binding NtrC family response regulator
MMSGHATIDTAVDAVKLGAHSFLEKPITLQKLLKAVEQGLSKEARAPARQASAAPAIVSAMAPMPQSFAVDMNEPEVEAAEVAQAFDLDRPLREARDDFERAYFEFHLNKERGSMTRVAEKTGLERTHLYRKLKQLGVDLGKGKKNGQI